jgi:hypothetical protein
MSRHQCATGSSIEPARPEKTFNFYFSATLRSVFFTGSANRAIAIDMF